MTNKLSIGVLCGGCSTEHEVSILSAKNVVAALDRQKYDVKIVYINLREEWYLIENIDQFLNHHPVELLSQQLMTYVTPELGARKPTLLSVQDPEKKFTVDCFIPILHGTHGEDGCMQGLFELMHVAYVGAGVLGSSICMDKDITKQLLKANGIHTTPWQVLHREDIRDGIYEKLRKNFGATLFVKPANLGSSVGVSKVTNEAEFLRAVQLAFQYDDCILVEQAIVGREIECAVLGNEEPIAALPAEIIAHAEFYSYDAKYLDPNGATTVVPADLPTSIVEEVRHVSIAAFKVLRCRGLLRVDFFLDKDNKLLVNEVNTIPGFTNISMYPAMWQASGTSYSELLDTLILLALQQHKQSEALTRVYSPVTAKSATVNDHPTSN